MRSRLALLVAVILAVAADVWPDNGALQAALILGLWLALVRRSFRRLRRQPGAYSHH